MQSLTPKQLDVLQALSSGLSVTAAADAAGIHRTTVHHWCRTIPEFREMLDALKQARIEAVREQMDALAAPSIAILRHILYDESAPPALRLRTAMSIIKFAASTPKSAAPRDVRTEAAHEIHHNSSLSPTDEPADESVEAAQPQTPRNALCPCGSGNKYKRCCGRNAPPVLGKAA